MGSTTQREAGIDPAVSSNVLTVTVPETGWWFIQCKFSPGTVRVLRVERHGKRPLLVPFNSGDPFLGFVTKTALDSTVGIYARSNLTWTDATAFANVGIDIWLEAGDRWLLINASGATVATDSVKYAMINTKHAPVLHFYLTDAIP